MKKMLASLLVSAVAVSALASDKTRVIKVQKIPVTMAEHTGTIMPITNFCEDDGRLYGLVPYTRTALLYGTRIITDSKKDADEFKKVFFKDNTRLVSVKTGQLIAISFPVNFTIFDQECGPGMDDKSNEWKKINCKTIPKEVSYKLRGELEVRSYRNATSHDYYVKDTVSYEVPSCL